MSEDQDRSIRLRPYRRYWLLPPLLLLFIVIIAGVALLSGNNEYRGLKPFRPTPSGGGLTIDGEATAVTFGELNGDPVAFQNQRLRVSGDYLPLPPPDCRPYSGPIFTWALVAEELQLNARNFEELMRRIPEGTTLTVEGVWRSYSGPLGCGKGAPEGVAWYLAVERIVAPNPLPALGQMLRPSDTAVSTPVAPTQLVSPTPDESPAAGSPTPGQTAVAPALSPTPTSATPQPTGTETAVTTTPTPDPAAPTTTPRGTPPTGSAPTVTAVASPTPPTGNATATPTPTGNATLPPQPTSPPLPTDPAYPVTTPTLTPTPESY